MDALSCMCYPFISSSAEVDYFLMCAACPELILPKLERSECTLLFTF